MAKHRQPQTRAERRRADQLRRRRERWSGVLRPGVAVLVVTAFLSGGVLEASLEQSARDRARAEQVLADDAAAAHAAQITAAAATRLSAQATAYAAHRRSQALVTAAAAVETADQLSTDVVDLVGADSLVALQSASAELAALVAATSVAVAASVQAPVPAPVDEPTTAATTVRLMIEPGSDAVELLAAGAARPEGDPATDPIAGDDATSGAASDLPAQLSAAARPMEAPGAVTGATSPAPAGPANAGASRLVQSPARTLADVPEEAARHLDLAVSDEVVAAAHQLLALTAQVQAEADATREAQRLAAEQAAAQAAAQAELEAAQERAARRTATVAAAENGYLPVDLLCGVSFDDDVLLRCDAAAALEQLNAAYRARSGRDLRVSSSYRDYAAQAATRAAKGSLAGLPGTSNHGLGLAIDLEDAGSLGDFSAPLYQWLTQHAGDHGWYHPDYMGPGGAGPAEPWHWEYGG